MGLNWRCLVMIILAHGNSSHALLQAPLGCCNLWDPVLVCVGDRRDTFFNYLCSTISPSVLHVSTFCCTSRLIQKVQPFPQYSACASTVCHLASHAIGRPLGQPCPVARSWVSPTGRWLFPCRCGSFDSPWWSLLSCRQEFYPAGHQEWLRCAIFIPSYTPRAPTATTGRSCWKPVRQEEVSQLTHTHIFKWRRRRLWCPLLSNDGLWSERLGWFKIAWDMWWWWYGRRVHVADNVFGPLSLTILCMCVCVCVCVCVYYSERMFSHMLSVCVRERCESTL